MASNPLRDLLANAHYSAVGVPLILILIGATAKKLVRGTGWQREDFFLGMELALAGMSSALIYVYEAAAAMNSARSAGTVNAESLSAAVVFLTISLFCLMGVMAIHQDQQRRRRSRGSQWFWLGGVTNMAGAVLLAAFILLVKGVQT